MVGSKSINTILGKLKIGPKPWEMALFLSVGLVLTGLIVSRTSLPAEKGIWGGPVPSVTYVSSEADLALGLAVGQAVIPDDPYNIRSGVQAASAPAGYLEGSLYGGPLPSPAGSLGRVSSLGSEVVLASAAGPEPTLPNLKGYFVMPTTGLDWGKLHPRNAVDIANACGTKIWAAAEGLVTEAQADGWNGGYGSYVTVEHPNGTRTRYAHLSKLSVNIGDYVKQKQELGLMGQTGDATGCHLHFEIEGAKNPFAK